MQTRHTNTPPWMNERMRVCQDRNVNDENKDDENKKLKVMKKKTKKKLESVHRAQTPPQCMPYQNRTNIWEITGFNWF